MPLDKGKCCDRKILDLGTYQFCTMCDRAYDMKGDQIKNWAWEKQDGKWVKIFGEKPKDVEVS